MPIIVSGRRATIEATSARRAPGVEAKLVMGRMLRSTGARARSSSEGLHETSQPRGRRRTAAMDETSRPLDVLISVSRDSSGTLGAQIEDQLRGAIREGALRPGTRV